MKQTNVFRPADLLFILSCIFFSFVSFLNTGKRYFQAGPFNLDRELIAGIIFIFLIPLAALLAFLSSRKENTGLEFIRTFYVQAFYPVFFLEAILLSQLFYNGSSFDAVFAGFDQSLFGFQPAQEFYKVFSDNPVVTEIFFFSYFSFFLIITAGWWVLFFQGKKLEARKSLFVITASFLVLNIFYTFFPVHGPKFFFPYLNEGYTENFSGFFFTPVMTGSLSSMNLAGAAVPSAHVALSTVAVFLNLKYNRILGIVLIPLTLILYGSTVFIYAHYASDVAAGLAAAIFILILPRDRIFERAEKITDCGGKWFRSRTPASPD